MTSKIPTPRRHRATVRSGYGQQLLTVFLQQVIMKIIKHSTKNFPTVVTGSLVGLDVGGTLEITNTFPFPVVEVPPESHVDTTTPNAAAAAPRAKANTVYQAEMIRMLREVNIDAQNVGWYTSANMGNFFNLNVIENQYFYQKELNERTVTLVHDVSRSAQGTLSLRAFRLSPQFMNAFKENKFTSEQYAHTAPHRIR
jgi:translation initiation factor 3 subunit H